MELFLNAYNSIKSSIWKDDTPDNIVFASAKEAFKKLSRGCTFGGRFFRLTGQSGSGKTSQLLSSCEKLCEKAKIKPLHIAVRNFAYLFPNYASISSRPDYREISNGFALKVLLCLLRLAFESGIDIILEIAILNRKFEKYIFEEIKNRNYFHLVLMLSVNQKISNSFIQKREQEMGRITNKSSADYFYQIMPKTLKYLVRKYDCECVIWTAFSLQPIYQGTFKDCYPFFKDGRKNLDFPACSENELLEAKKTFLEEEYLDALV